METDRAPVVAKALPLADHVGAGSGGEGLHRRPALQPGEIAGDNAVDLRLLEHHLGDEDRVGIARLPPRKVAAVGPKPLSKQTLAHCSLDSLAG
jgi:hypothetical protein